MQQEKIMIHSHFDNTPISVLMVIPTKPPKAIVQLVHGMSEHKERYLDVMNYLAEQGFVCVIHDHRGHGESIRDQSELGYMNKNGAKGLIEDTNQVHHLIRKKYRHIPLFLLGHSMGALVVRAYIKRSDRVVDGLIVIGSPSYNPASKLAMYLAKLMGKVMGEKEKGSIFHKLAFGKFNHKVNDFSSPYAWICSNTEVVKEYDQDEYCGFVFTMNGFEHLFRLMTKVYSTNHWHINKPKLPILFLSGEEDPCMLNKKKFEESIELMHKVGYHNVSSKLYKNMRHEILNETSKEKVYHDIATQLEIWLEHN